MMIWDSWVQGKNAFKPLYFETLFANLFSLLVVRHHKRLINILFVIVLACVLRKAGGKPLKIQCLRCMKVSGVKSEVPQLNNQDMFVPVISCFVI